MNKRELEDAIRDEVAEWPGVTVEFENPAGKGHPKAKLMFGELVLRRPYAGTPSDAMFGLHRCLGDMRRVMKQLGASRAKPEPSKDETEKRYTKPNPGADMRELPRSSAPSSPEPDMADKLVSAGAATPEQREAVQAEESAATYERRTLFERMADQARGDEGERGRDDEQPDQADEAAQRRAEIEAAALAIEDGVYFDLPEAIYHRVEALGGGSICDLLVSPGTFWAGSWLDPDRPDPDVDATDAQIIGRAYHVARLEPMRFAYAYARRPGKADYPKCKVWNSTQIGEKLAELGATKKRSGESVAQQAQRLEDEGFEGPIWPLIEARWFEEIGKRDPVPIALDGKVWDEIERDAGRLRSVPEIADLLDRGQSEVSVFWTDEQGFRRKARFDKLAADRWVDLKTFQNSNRKALDQAIADAFRYNRYYVGATHYRDAAEAIRTQGLQVKGPASDEARELIAAIQIRPTDLACWYVFQEKGGVPNLLARRFRFHLEDGTERAIRELEDMGADEAHLERARRFQEIADSVPQLTQIGRRGRIEVDRALALYQLYSEVYPAGEPWAPIDPMGTLDDLDFNPRWLEGMQP